MCSGIVFITFSLVVAIYFALYDVIEFSSNKLLAYRRQVVDVKNAVEVVALVLHHSGQVSRYGFFVRGEILVDPIDFDFFY